VLGIGQRADHEDVDHAEDSSACGDPERQGEDRHGDQAAAVTQGPQAIFDILPDDIHGVLPPE
jgi:hypothetical protein